MAAGITDKFTETTNGTRPVPTTLTAIRAVGATSISCGALTGWPTATSVHFIIYTTDTNGNKIAGSQLDCKGIVSGTTITNIIYKAGNDNGNSIGAIVEAAPTAAWADDVVEGLVVEHNQNGTHSNVTATSVTATTGTFTTLNVTGTPATNGWTTLGAAPTTVTALGNRSYTILVPGVDKTNTVSNGMRLQIPRTVTPPTQCASLNGTNHYFSKSSPNKLTFTDDFVVSAWIKLSSYGAGGDRIIASRYNGTSGWELAVKSTGNLVLAGYNGGAANVSYVYSQQSLPLNKWVHVAAQLDMSAFTATSTTSYTMIDGVDVAAAVNRGGTNPTALVQAGNLEIGSWNGGINNFAGKIAQVAIYNAKVTQATILASMNQTLTGSETSLASAYSFNNSIIDLNASTPNDLTANNGVLATTVDSPMNATEYAIIMNNSFSTDTTLTVQVPEGYTLPTSGGINTPNYSYSKAPYGFPAGAGLLGLVRIMVNQSTTSTSSTAILGASVSTYVGVGQRIRLVLDGSIANSNTSIGIYPQVFAGTIGASTLVKGKNITSTSANYSVPFSIDTEYFTTTAGQLTFNAGYKTDANTATVIGNVTEPLEFRVELVNP